MKLATQQLKKLFEDWAKEEISNIIPLAQSGSYRKYFRIMGSDRTAIGVFNPDTKENNAFIGFTKHFLNKGLNVPELYTYNKKENIYLLQDLGNTTLFSLIDKKKNEDELLDEVLKFYKEALDHLIRFQIDGGKGLDYSICYPRKKFDKQSIMWDLNYFKYYFLKLAKISFDEQRLEDDFRTFAEILLSADMRYFMYRDFQSRNILVHNNELYFVDYQGGRRGALQYDVASLLFQAKVNLSESVREELLSYYLVELKNRIKFKTKEFKKYYYDYALIRLFQTLGAYGFRGYYENKSHFLLSIPFAIKNLKWLKEKNHIPKKLPELTKVINSILQNEKLIKPATMQSGEKLKVTINSFSYQEGIPNDLSGNGGGFVFDCRSLVNPGRYPEYTNSTGLDVDVINFLQDKNDVKDFLNSVYSIVDESVKNYIGREFRNLMINFGCTGGRHRSVFCAENLAKHLREKFDVSIEVNHIKLNSEANV